MKYVIEILKKELQAEKKYKYAHEKTLREGAITASSKRVFEMSVRLAQERIPQLEKALKVLKKY